MTKVLIILSFVMMVYGCSKSFYEPVRYKQIDVFYVERVRSTRFEGNDWKEYFLFKYRDNNGGDHLLERYYGETYVLNIRE